MTKKSKQEYTNYVPAKLGPVETIKTPTSEYLFENYVVPRKPVVIRGTQDDYEWDQLALDNIVTTLDYENDLLVEEKHQFGFGGGHDRVKMTLEELVDKIRGGSEEFYLTTQYEEEEEEEEQEKGDEKRDDDEDGSDDDNDDGEDDDDDDDDEESPGAAHLNSIIQPPLSNLIFSSFPIESPLLPTLIPQQINLWMGNAPKNPPTAPKFNPSAADGGLGRYIPPVTHNNHTYAGTSLGLHHDHADNLYVLVSGIKRFTLYSPAFAHQLATVGSIYRVYNSGVIDYIPDEKAPGWKPVRDDGAIISEIEGTGDQPSLDTTGGHPPLFSTIPPALLHIDDFTGNEKVQIKHFAESHFPQMLLLAKLEVWLHPGEKLYIPAGWFHEVSSFGPDPHVALNYWYVPPVQNTLDNPYHNDGYWQTPWKSTQEYLHNTRQLFVDDDNNDEIDDNNDDMDDNNDDSR